MPKLLQVQNLNVFISHCEKNFYSELHLIKQLSFELELGEMLAIVGSSGSGKSLLAHSLLGILPQNSYQNGKIYFEEQELDATLKGKLRGHEMALIPQSISFLNPLMKIEKQILGEHNNLEKQKHLNSLFKIYGLDLEIKNKYPFELSGGMVRRVLICTALINNPKLIIADEPTPGIHSTTAKDVMQHLRELANNGKGILLITHDLELALEFADRLLIFNDGMILECLQNKNSDVYSQIKNPYTKELFKALPQNYKYEF